MSMKIRATLIVAVLTAALTLGATLLLQSAADAGTSTGCHQTSCWHPPHDDGDDECHETACWHPTTTTTVAPDPCAGLVFNDVPEDPELLDCFHPPAPTVAPRPTVVPKPVPVAPRPDAASPVAEAAPAPALKGTPKFTG